MKVISQLLGIMITLLALFNILRLLISLIESYFSMNFGIDFVLHNNYVTYGNCTCCFSISTRTYRTSIQQ